MPAQLCSQELFFFFSLFVSLTWNWRGELSRDSFIFVKMVVISVKQTNIELLPLYCTVYCANTRSSPWTKTGITAGFWWIICLSSLLKNMKGSLKIELKQSENQLDFRFFLITGNMNRLLIRTSTHTTHVISIFFQSKTKDMSQSICPHTWYLNGCYLVWCYLCYVLNIYKVDPRFTGLKGRKSYVKAVYN